jgi:methanogenic corrinoid protein MtbC1
MYTIRQAAAMSAVEPTRIRAWERRYGIVEPERTPAGYRLYDDRMIATLRAMRALIDDGWHAAQAASAIGDGSVALDAWFPIGSASTAEALADGSGPVMGEDPIATYVRGAAAYDLAMIEIGLDGIYAGGSFEAIVDDALLPAASALGAAWADGTVDVGGEHLASAAMLRRLAASFDAAARTSSDEPVVVGLPPGSRHELGALAFAVSLRRRGASVLYLGADVPIASWVHAVTSRSARGVVIGVVMPDDVPPASELVAALVRQHPGLTIALGGSSATAVDVGTAEVLILPPRVTQAAAAVASALS